MKSKMEYTPFKCVPMMPIEKLFPAYNENEDSPYHDLLADGHCIGFKYHLNDKDCEDYDSNLPEGFFLRGMEICTEKEMSPRFATDLFEMYGLVLWETKPLNEGFTYFHFKHNSFCHEA